MGKLKPIGSEKLQGIDKINRILEISKYKEVLPQPINESSSNEYSVKLSDGHTYQIVREKNGYVIKKSLNEGSVDYIEPMKNRKYYPSYSQAFKRLNLIVKEVNSLTGNDSEISLFSEQKKYTLKTPKPEPVPSTDTAAPPTDTATPGDLPSPDAGSEDIPSPDMSGLDDTEDVPDSPESMGPPADEPSDMGSEDTQSDMDGGPVTMKTIQKLTGKLGQKIRQFSDEQELSSNDAKYVINSILSAIDLSLLDPEDKEEIMARLEGEESDMMDTESPDMSSPDMSSPDMESPDMGGEMKEMNTLGRALDTKIKSVYSGALADKLEAHESQGVNKILDSVFSESKVEKIIKSYFIVDQDEKKSKDEARLKNLSETYKQEIASKKLIEKYPNILLVGKTNKNNLLFQLENKKIKINPKGQII